MVKDGGLFVKIIILVYLIFRIFHPRDLFLKNIYENIKKYISMVGLSLHVSILLVETLFNSVNYNVFYSFSRAVTSNVGKMLFSR